MDDFVARILPSWSSLLAIAGTPDDCVAALHRLAAAGADTVVLALQDIDDADHWQSVTDRVLPQMATR